MLPSTPVFTEVIVKFAPDDVAESLRRAVRAAIAERWGKKPICHVHVLVV